MLYLNSSHSACRREAQLEIDRATAMAAPGLHPVVQQRAAGLANAAARTWL